MTIEAINKIENLALSANEALRRDIGMNAIALPADMKLESLEKFSDQRSRYRVQMSSTVISEYARFVDEEIEQNFEEGEIVQCFINPSSMSATTYFNLGDSMSPGHGDHRARLVLSRTAEYAALLDIAKSKVSQKEAAEFIEDWRPHVHALNSEGHSLDLNTAISQIRKMTFDARAESTHEQQSLRTSVSSFEQIELRDKEKAPAEIRFTCEPYQGLPPKEIFVRLSMITGDKPGLIFRIVRAASVEEEIADDFRATLADAFNTKAIRIYTGDLSL